MCHEKYICTNVWIFTILFVAVAIAAYFKPNRKKYKCTYALLCADSSLTTLYIWNVRCVTRANWSHRFPDAIVRWAWGYLCAQDVVVARPVLNDDCKIIAWLNVLGSFGTHWQQQQQTPTFFGQRKNQRNLYGIILSRFCNVVIESADACLQHLQELFFSSVFDFNALLCAFSIKW